MTLIDLRPLLRVVLAMVINRGSTYQSPLLERDVEFIAHHALYSCSSFMKHFLPYDATTPPFLDDHYSSVRHVSENRTQKFHFIV